MKEANKNFSVVHRFVGHFVLAALFFMCGQYAIGQDEFDEHGRWINGIMEPLFLVEHAYTLDQAKIFRNKWKSILKTGTGAKPEMWAGDYGRGYLHEGIIRISEQGGYAYASVFTCSAELLRIDYGSASVDPALVTLSSEFTPNQSSGGHSSHQNHGGSKKLHARYLPVKWGAWRLLIEDNRVAEFYNFVVGLDASDSFSFFIRREETVGEPEGMPILPPGYERFVRYPVKAKILSVGTTTLVPFSDDGKSFQSEISVRISAGSAHGLRKDSRLYVVGSRQMEFVKVRRVSRNSAWGVIERNVDDNKVEKYWDHDSESYEDYPKINGGTALISNILLAKQS